MIMLNIGSKYITIELSKTQEEYAEKSCSQTNFNIFYFLDGNT